MFKAISIKLALQFTAFVTLLLLINGAAFIAADYRYARGALDNQAQRLSDRIVGQLPSPLSDVEVTLPPRERDRVRIADASGQLLYSGNLFSSVPFDLHAEPVTDIDVDEDQLRYVTTPIVRSGTLVGYLQLIRRDNIRPGDLPRRGLILLITSALISVLTFLLGLLFARSSLRPAEETMQRLEQFTQDASHELRTPLAVLGSSIDVALKTGKHKEGLLSAKDDLRQLGALIERLLELAYLNRMALAVESVDLSSLVSETAHKLQSLAMAQSVTIKTDIAPGVRVQGDATLLRQAAMNLITNAIKFNRTGGTLQIRLTQNSLSVADTGIGIPAVEQPRIFDRFYRADASRSTAGFGLGLSFVKRIVELHGWKIVVRSEEGKGSTFAIKL